MVPASGLGAAQGRAGSDFDFPGAVTPRADVMNLFFPGGYTETETRGVYKARKPVTAKGMMTLF